MNKMECLIQDTGFLIQDTECRQKIMHASCIMHRASKRAISTVEYVILIAVIVAALLAMQFYLRRAVCGRIRSAGDTFGQGRQYQPGVTVVTEN